MRRLLTVKCHPGKRFFLFFWLQSDEIQCSQMQNILKWPVRSGALRSMSKGDISKQPRHIERHCTSPGDGDLPFAGSSQKKSSGNKCKHQYNNKIKEQQIQRLWCIEIKICRGKEETVPPETPAVHIFVVKVATSCSSLLNSELTKG